MNLQQLQSQFQDIILSAECTGAGWVGQSAQGVSSHNRLAIYHNAYRVRLIDVLLDTFEHTATYLGDDWFRELASVYVQSHHSTHNNIGLYGWEFPRFLAEKLADDGEISELATMDWRLRRAFDGADSITMTHDDLQLLATGNSGPICLRPVPTLSVSTQHFNTLNIWHAIDQDECPPVATRLDQPVDVVIWRKGHAPHFRSLSRIESSAMAGVCSGLTLDAIGAALEEEFPDVDIATAFGVLLHRWLDDQLLAVAQ